MNHSLKLLIVYAVISVYLTAMFYQDLNRIEIAVFSGFGALAFDLLFFVAGFKGSARS